MKFTVERIEDGIAVLEDEQGSFTEINASLLPPQIKSGSIVTSEDGVYKMEMQVDKDRKKMLFEKQQKLLNRNKK